MSAASEAAESAEVAGSARGQIRERMIERGVQAALGVGGRRFPLG